MHHRAKHLGILAALALWTAESVFAGSPHFSFEGAQTFNQRPLVLDPELVGVGPDKDAAVGSHYGMALYELNAKVASFLPTGTSDEELSASQESLRKKLDEMLRKARLSNKDPKATTKTFVLISGSTVQTIEVPKDSPGVLQNKIAELEAQVRELEAARNPYLREKDAARREYWEQQKTKKH